MNQQSIQKRKRSDSAEDQPQKRARGRPRNITKTHVRKISPAELEEVMAPLYDTFEEIVNCNLEVAAIFTLLRGVSRFICGCCGGTDHAGTTRQLYNYETTYNVCNACGLRFKAFVERLHNGGDGRPIRPQSQRTSHIRKTYSDYVYHKTIPSVAETIPSGAETIPSGAETIPSGAETIPRVPVNTPVNTPVNAPMSAPIGTPELTAKPISELPRINKPIVKPTSPLPLNTPGLITKREVASLRLFPIKNRVVIDITE